MKIALVTNFLYPEYLGGTELYCHELGKALIRQGNEVYWIVPNFDTHETIQYTDGSGLKVIKFPAVEAAKLPDETYVNISLVNTLKENGITVAHMHEFGGYEGISGASISAAKRAGITVIATLHLVHYICRTGTMRYAGSDACNGLFSPHRCAACNKLSGSTGNSRADKMLTGMLSASLKMIRNSSKSVMNNKFSALNRPLKLINALKEADAVVSLAGWFRDVLITNGIDKDKIIMMPQTSPLPGSGVSSPVANRKGYVFVGRVNKEKGIGLLEEAALKLKDVLPDSFIDVYGPVSAGNEFSKKFIERIGKLNNIHYKGVIPPQQVASVISNYKALLLPSLVAEMAPLTIMEANQVCVPVIASDVPGCRELINEYDCGLIFKYNSSEDLVDNIATIENQSIRFRFDSPGVNNFSDLAIKYEALYKSFN